MAEYEGTIIPNEAYKVKKLIQQLGAAKDGQAVLQSALDHITLTYEAQIADLKSTIAKLNERQPSPGRPRKIVAKPARKRK